MARRPYIASLVPSGTDLVGALGLEDHLVGVSHECDHPGAHDKPVLTSSQLPSTSSARGSSGEDETPPPMGAREVDTRVVETTQRGEPLYYTDRERLEELQPDVVISQSVCDVCAVGADQVTMPSGATLLNLTGHTIEGMYEDIGRVGQAAGAHAKAVRLVEEVRAAVEAVHEKVYGREPRKGLGLEWSDPPYTGGHWVPELFTLAGGEHVLGGPGERSRRTAWPEIDDADPDVIVFMPCGYRLPHAVYEARRLAAAPEPGAVRAIRNGHLWATDASVLFSRCTPQSVPRAAEVLAGILHPDVAGPPDSALTVPIPS